VAHFTTVLTVYDEVLLHDLWDLKTVKTVEKADSPAHPRLKPWAKENMSGMSMAFIKLMINHLYLKRTLFMMVDEDLSTFQDLTYPAAKIFSIYFCYKIRVPVCQKLRLSTIGGG